MALFSRSKKEKADAAPALSPKANAGVPASLARILVKPRITEKATLVQTRGAYVFDVAPTSTKTQIAEAVRLAYKVTPRAVKIIPVRSKIVRSARTGKTGVKRGGKKAYVFLKQGDSITLA